MKDINLKDIKTTGVFTRTKKNPKRKLSHNIRRKKFLGSKSKKMIITGTNHNGNIAANEDVFRKYGISSHHIYTIETHPFKANLVIGEPLDNEALIMSYYAQNKIEVHMSAMGIGINSPSVKSRLIFRMVIDLYFYLIVYDSLILEAFRNDNDIHALIKYSYEYLSKLKTERR